MFKDVSVREIIYLSDLLYDKSCFNILSAASMLILLNGCSYHMISEYTNKYVDCSYDEETEQCKNPKLKLFNKYGSLSARIRPGKEYSVQYRIKF